MLRNSILLSRTLFHNHMENSPHDSQLLCFFFNYPPTYKQRIVREVELIVRNISEPLISFNLISFHEFSFEVNYLVHLILMYVILMYIHMHPIIDNHFYVNLNFSLKPNSLLRYRLILKLLRSRFFLHPTKIMFLLFQQ